VWKAGQRVASMVGKKVVHLVAELVAVMVVRWVVLKADL